MPDCSECPANSRLASIIDRVDEGEYIGRADHVGYHEDQKDDQIARTAGWASLSKFAGTDAGVKNTHMALEIMGQAGIRHDRGAEKLFRDAKLLQIYEGTNQLNRLNLFKCLIARDNPQVTVFNNER